MSKTKKKASAKPGRPTKDTSLNPPAPTEVKSPESEKLDLDQTDMLLVENSMLKEQLETYRHKLIDMNLKSDRESLHDYFVEKYKINLDKFTFSIDGGKQLVVTPK